jgi:DNA-binding MarR family transcriptional regulator
MDVGSGPDLRGEDALVAIRKILRVAEFASRDVADRTGLTPSQLIVLQFIAREGQSGAGRVAEAARLSQATVTAICDRLEERQLIVRQRDREDRRRISIELTQAGRTMLVGTPDILQNRFLARFQRLADWERAGIVAALERVATLLDAEGIDASPFLDVGKLDRPTRET